jgi:hypothetical protein
MSCEKCGREIKNYGIFLGGIRCANYCSERWQHIKKVVLMTNEKPKHGGPRPNSGRKPMAEADKKVPVCFRLARDLDEYLKTVDDKTAVLEDSLRKSKGFKEWKKNYS